MPSPGTSLPGERGQASGKRPTAESASGPRRTTLLREAHADGYCWTVLACPECGWQSTHDDQWLGEEPVYCLEHEGEDRSERPELRVYDVNPVPASEHLALAAKAMTEEEREAAVEAGARSRYEYQRRRAPDLRQGAWEELVPPVRESYKNEARAVLTALLGPAVQEEGR
jgi:hypothetical protein